MPLDFVRLPQLLLPAPTVDLSRFAVIACDQFTAEPALWAETERLVGDAPSALHLILPEVYLDASADRIPAIHRTMQSFLQNGILCPLPAGLMLIERHTGRTAPRRGVLLAFDLEAYDETPGADAPIVYPPVWRSARTLLSSCRTSSCSLTIRRTRCWNRCFIKRPSPRLFTTSRSCRAAAV